MKWYEAAFGDMYPLVYTHRDVAEAERAASHLAPMVARGRPMLDVACGSGRHMSALAGVGVDVYGIDLSEYLLGQAALDRRLAGRLVCGDMRALPFRDAAFGSAINMFTSFGYFETDSENAGVVREVARVLVEKGTFVLDFLNAGNVRRNMRTSSRRIAGDAEVDEQRSLSADGRVLTKHVQVLWPGREPAGYVERLRLYTRDELTAMLAEAGFDVRRVHGDYDLGPFDAADSARVILVGEKRSGA